MSFVILIPGILCVLALLRGKTRAAFLDVFIPVLMLLPSGYTLTVRPIPPLGFVTTALLPLIIAMIFWDFSRWKFSRTDLWMAIFVFSTSYTEFIIGETSGSILDLFAVVTGGLFPYMVGKLLIEQPGMRIKVVKRIVWLLTITSTLSMYEFFRRTNPFRVVGIKIFPEQWPELLTQVRNGFGRLGGPYGGAEQAGIVLLIGLTFAVWLGSKSAPNRPRRERTIVSPKRAKVMISLIVLALLMTQSRGPWIGAFISLCIASIGRAKKPLRRAALVFGLGLLVGVPTYIAGKDYVSGPRTDYGSERETAQYRALLIDNYIPVAELGGAWGWGGPLGFPRIGGQTSIDNEYLLVWLIQGYMGLLAFILLFVEATISLVRLGIKAKWKRERSFVFTLLGVIFGIASTIVTVYLGSQLYPMFFLLIGWSQAIKPFNVNEMEDPEAGVQQITPERTLVRIYT